MSKAVWKTDEYDTQAIADVENALLHLEELVRFEFGRIGLAHVDMDRFELLLFSVHQNGAKAAERLLQAERLAAAKRQVGLTLSALVENLVEGAEDKEDEDEQG